MRSSVHHPNIIT